jgi:hypothetical protein
VKGETGANVAHIARVRDPAFVLCRGLRLRVSDLIGSRLNQCNETQAADSQGKAQVARLLSRESTTSGPSARAPDQAPGGIKRRDGLAFEDSEAMGIDAAQKDVA